MHQVTWSPGDPEIIEGRLLNQGGWSERRDIRAYNLYSTTDDRAGRPGPGRPVGRSRAAALPRARGPHHRWFAHRVQRPLEKVNHALLLGGAQGIGKDTILKPVREAVGPWNLCRRLADAGRGPVQRIPEVGDSAGP